jgi:hypothetical protein
MHTSPLVVLHSAPSDLNTLAHVLAGSVGETVLMSARGVAGMAGSVGTIGGGAVRVVGLVPGVRCTTAVRAASTILVVCCTGGCDVV